MSTSNINWNTYHWADGASPNPVTEPDEGLKDTGYANTGTDVPSAPNLNWLFQKFFALAKTNWDERRFEAYNSLADFLADTSTGEVGVLEGGSTEPYKANLASISPTTNYYWQGWAVAGEKAVAVERNDSGGFIIHCYDSSGTELWQTSFSDSNIPTVRALEATPDFFVLVYQVDYQVTVQIRSMADGSLVDSTSVSSAKQEWYLALLPDRFVLSAEGEAHCYLLDSHQISVSHTENWSDSATLVFDAAGGWFVGRCTDSGSNPGRAIFYFQLSGTAVPMNFTQADLGGNWYADRVATDGQRIYVAAHDVTDASIQHLQAYSLAAVMSQLWDVNYSSLLANTAYTPKALFADGGNVHLGVKSPGGDSIKWVVVTADGRPVQRGSLTTFTVGGGASAATDGFLGVAYASSSAVLIRAKGRGRLYLVRQSSADFYDSAGGGRVPWYLWRQLDY